MDGTTHIPSSSRFTETPNGYIAMASLSASTFQGGRPSRQWISSFTAAALVLLTLIGSYFAFGGSLRLGWHERAPASIPALIATPDAILPPGVSEVTVLFRQPLHQIPRNVEWAGSGRVTVDAGTEWPQGTVQTTGVGPMLYRVESGTLRVWADGPFSVTPAETTTATQVPARTDVLLSAGDSIFIDSGVASRWRNDGPSTAVVLEAGLTSFGTYDLPSGITFDALSVGMTLNETPTAPAELSLRRVVLAPGGRLPIQPQAGLEALGVESGGVHIALSNVADPTQQTDPKLMFAGSWLDLNAQVYNAKGQHFLPSEIRNDGTDAATLFLLTVTPLGGQAGTPTS